MSRTSIGLTEAMSHYLAEVGYREDELLKRLRAETATLPLAMMQISPEQGAFMTLFARTLNARQIIEIGSFTGYSGLCLARALPDQGRLYCLDISEEWTNIAKRYWQEAGLAARIELRLAPALDSLAALTDELPAGTIDLAFVDAHKPDYQAYVDLLHPLLRVGGVIMVDNTLWDGRVLNPDHQDANTQAIRSFNQRLHSDLRFELALIPLGDGLTLLRKR